MVSHHSFFQTSIAIESLAEVGHPLLDGVLFSWSIKQLCVPLSPVAPYFLRIENNLTSPKRFFHRGLGHIRLLFPPNAQRAYYIWLSTDIYANKTLTVSHLNQLEQILDNIIPATEKNTEAYGILSAFYHSMVHEVDDLYLINTIFDLTLPDYQHQTISALLLNKKSVKQMLSCVVAESELTHLGVAPYHLVPIILAIYSASSWRHRHQPAALKKCLYLLQNTLQLAYTPLTLTKILETVLGVANRQIGYYGYASLLEFHKKILALMQEAHPFLLTQTVPLNEWHARDRFLQILQTKLLNLSSRSEALFYSLDDKDARIALFNQHAKKLIAQEVYVNQLLITALKIHQACLKQNLQLTQWLAQFKPYAYDEHLNDIPPEVATLLKHMSKSIYLPELKLTLDLPSYKTIVFLLKIFKPQTLINDLPQEMNILTYLEQTLGHTTLPRF